MSRTSRTISVLDGDWERWTRAAGERGIADRGRAYSVSEYVRRAVEAYSGNPDERSGFNGPEGAKAEAGTAGKGGHKASVQEGAPDADKAVLDGTRGLRAGLGDGPGHGAGVADASADHGGAVKREAKAPSTGESDPAAPPWPGESPDRSVLRKPYPKTAQLGGKK